MEYEEIAPMTTEEVLEAIKKTNDIVTSREFIESLPLF